MRGEYLSSSKRDTHAMQGIDIAFRIVYQIKSHGIVEVIKMLYPIFYYELYFQRLH